MALFAFLYRILGMAITKIEEIENFFPLTDDEKKGCELSFSSGLPLLVSDFYFSLIDQNDKNCPIRRQVIPSSLEFIESSETLDPFLEETKNVNSRLIHRYTSRAALLTTDRCFSYCRHCFRRRFTGKDSGEINNSEIDNAVKYLKDHKEINELLLTGGDMFTMSDEKIDYILNAIKRNRPDIIVRLCTRSVVTMPERFNDSLFSVIEKYKDDLTMFLLTQFNHEREITKEAVSVVHRFISLGIVPFNQSVLLRGVNDSVKDLKELCNKLLKNKIKPYYLFQGDLVKGTSHLRVPLSKGFELENELRNELSGLAMPQYTIDLPEAGGKVILTDDKCLGLNKKKWSFESTTGKIIEYPED